MSEKYEVNIGTVDGSDGRGCLFFFGIIIVATCIGILYASVYGWLIFGIAIMLWAMLARSSQ